jgi:hypothetical protein
MTQERLYDIKPLLEIPDGSLYLYWGLILFGGLLFVGILFFFLKRLWQARQKSLEKSYLLALKSLDWVDSKKCAYEATRYGRLLATDERRQKLFAQLEPLLQAYKYKKEVEEVDMQTLNQWNLYVQVCDESI